MVRDIDFFQTPILDLHSVSSLFLVIASSSFGIGYGQNGTYNVLDFGASGDGVVDDSQAFLKAWQTACGTPGASQTLSIPQEKTYLLEPLNFEGPCKSNNVQIHVDGNIVGPSDPNVWKTACQSGCWLCFENVKGLVIKGSGHIDGKGAIWWNQEDKFHCKAPTALHFHKCDQLQLSGFTSQDSPRNHIFIHQCTGVHISNVHLNAPENSPNTDGIDISLSSKIDIRDSSIGTGDDCIAIKGGSSFVNITNVACGPGHGISVGSLGQGGADDRVEQVHVQHCTFTNTQNGARIKTWKGGAGYAKSIFYNQITLVRARNPIIIHQHYIDEAQVEDSAVKVSDVTYTGFQGTSASEQAITLDCDNLGCSNIVMDHVNLTSAVPGKPVLKALCNNANGKSSFTTPVVPCLSS